MPVVTQDNYHQYVDIVSDVVKTWLAPRATGWDLVWFQVNWVAELMVLSVTLIRKSDGLVHTGTGSALEPVNIQKARTMGNSILSTLPAG